MIEVRKLEKLKRIVYRKKSANVLSFEYGEGNQTFEFETDIKSREILQLVSKKMEVIKNPQK